MKIVTLIRDILHMNVNVNEFEKNAHASSKLIRFENTSQKAILL